MLTIWLNLAFPHWSQYSQEYQITSKVIVDPVGSTEAASVDRRLCIRCGRRIGSIRREALVSYGYVRDILSFETSFNLEGFAILDMLPVESRMPLQGETALALNEESTAVWSSRTETW